SIRVPSPAPARSATSPASMPPRRWRAPRPDQVTGGAPEAPPSSRFLRGRGMPRPRFRCDMVSMIRWPHAIVLAVIGILALDPAATRAQERRDGLVAALLAEGEAAFPRTCAACHGADGGGRIGPPLRNNTASVRGLVRVLQF